MSVHLTEEEQLEKLKLWWKEYGKTIVLVVVVSVGGYFTWTGWQDQKQAKAERASASYQQILDVTQGQPLEQLDDSQRGRLAELAEDIKEINSNSFYAQSAAMMLAKLAVDDGNLELAEAELRWVLEQRARPTTEPIAKLRLARVLAARENYGEALTLLEATGADAFTAKRAEIRGDILLAQGDRDGARQAYEEALAALDGGQREHQMILQMKLDDVQTHVAGENA